MKKLLILLFSLFLIGCQSNIIETTIKSSEIKDAINGEVQDIEFETNFSLMAELDETTKIELAKIESISSKYIDIEDFDVTEDHVLVLRNVGPVKYHFFTHQMEAYLPLFQHHGFF